MEDGEGTLSGFTPVSSRGFGRVIEISFIRFFRTVSDGEDNCVTDFILFLSKGVTFLMS